MMTPMPFSIRPSHSRIIFIEGLAAVQKLHAFIESTQVDADYHG